MPKYAELVYNGFWFSPERKALQALIDSTQEYVTGTVRLKLYKVRHLPAPQSFIYVPVVPEGDHLSRCHQHHVGASFGLRVSCCFVNWLS